MVRPFGTVLLFIACFRAALGGLFIILFDVTDKNFVTYCIFIIILAQASDHIDGFIARKYSTPCPEGYIQDSIADKLFHFGVLLAVQREFDLSPIIVWLVIMRDLIIIAMRIMAKEIIKDLPKYKVYSILFAMLLRGGLLIFVVIPLIPNTQLSSALYYIALMTLCASLIPATIGQVLMLVNKAK
jgi:phosphatidylglycerophosphate synthase